jgi:hypothetical protein
MKTATLLVAVVLLTACEHEPLSTQRTGKDARFEVEQLFTHDGCTVYRFHDNGYAHYFTNCASVISSRTVSCGKNCTAHREEEIMGRRTAP